MARGLFLAVVLSLCLTAPARAGEAFISVDGSDVAYLHFEDPAGVPDEIRIPPTAERTITLLGPTVVAGDGCVPVAGGASCTRPSRAHVWERTIIDTGGGDDTVVVETSHQMRIFGNDGNDRISLGPQTIGEVSGGDGDDVLATAASAILFGGAGNDHLSAGARSGLSGDAGADRLEGSPQDDVLVDAGDRGSRDVLACNGGADVMQIDETDALEGCTSAAFDKISRTKFYWEVRYGPRVSIPTLLRVRRLEVLRRHSGLVRAVHRRAVPWREVRGGPPRLQAELHRLSDRARRQAGPLRGSLVEGRFTGGDRAGRPVVRVRQRAVHEGLGVPHPRPQGADQAQALHGRDPRVPAREGTRTRGALYVTPGQPA